MAAEVQRRSEVQSNCRNASEFQYTACYCEENIYMLCKALREQGVADPDLSDLFVVFISNDIQQVPIWRQRNSSSGSDGFCVWDYHVICIQKTSGPDEALVWDLDTTLSLPVRLNLYLKEAFRPYINFDKMYSRRHMKTPEGRWRAPPPPCQCIKAEGGEVHNLEDYNTVVKEQVQYIVDDDFDRLLTDKYGLVVCEDGFARAFAGHRSQAPAQKLDTNSHQLILNS